jgi:TfoX/Sxy family transcriptional regulator of competence genes
MAVNEALLCRVRAALDREMPVVEKKMFGSIVFMVRGKMCVGVGRDRLMCRIDPAVHDEALERKGCRTVVMKGRQYRGYVHVEAQAVPSRRELDFWISLSLDYNRKLHASSQKEP